VPAIASGAAAELDPLRAACDRALEIVLRAEPAVVTLVGTGPQARQYFPPYVASFAGFGVAETARLGGGHQRPVAEELPLSLAVGVWLMRRALDAGIVHRPTTWRALTVPVDEPVADCRALGEVEGTAEYRHALVVLGDGSACRTEKAPGYLDPRAEEFDASVSKALASLDTDALLALDPVLAGELLAVGRAPWQVLAAAAAAAPQPLTGEVLYDAAPYGVQYTVGAWTT
jgi:hypothetical protein